MNIAGMGMVSARGRGMAALEQALEQGWVPPLEVEVKGLPSGRLPVYAVPAEAMSDKTVLAKARRADRFTRMAVLAASDALQDSGLGATLDKARLGIIVATALGPHATTFSFLDGILDFGDAAVSPTAFSHSVHNAAASYIAMTLDVRGPTLTVTHFQFAFQQAVLLARTWLDDGRCDAVLVGTVDELGAVMHHICGRMTKPPADGRIKPFAFSAAPETVPGEGSAFFLMTRESAGSSYAHLAPVVLAVPEVPAPARALQLLDADGMAKDETAYHAAVIPGIPVAGYAPLFGGLLTGSAFQAAVAALMLKKQRRYASPVLDNPHALSLLHETSPVPLDAVFCTKLDCSRRPAQLLLSLS
jgi:3-oxoacyl-[acyl-carrier-protein] synthase II